MLAPLEVTPFLSNAFRYSRASDLRCSSVIVWFVIAIRFARTRTFCWKRDTISQLTCPASHFSPTEATMPKHIGVRRDESAISGMRRSVFGVAIRLFEQYLSAD